MGLLNYMISMQLATTGLQTCMLAGFHLEGGGAEASPPPKEKEKEEEKKERKEKRKREREMGERILILGIILISRYSNVKLTFKEHTILLHLKTTNLILMVCGGDWT